MKDDMNYKENKEVLDKESIISMRYQDGTITYPQMIQEIKTLYYNTGYRQASTDLNNSLNKQR